MNKALKKIKDMLQRCDITASRDIYESTDDRTKKYYAGMCYGLRMAKEIVNKVEEECKNNIVYNLATAYAISLNKYGVDISGKLETATQNEYAMNKAYMRGRQDERERFDKWREEFGTDINDGSKEGKDINVLASSPDKTDRQVIFSTSSRCKVKCKNCSRLYEDYDEENEIVLGQKCDKIIAYPDVEMERHCIFYKPMTNGDRIRRMKDEELAEIVFCPYDTAGENIMPCITEENKNGEFTEKDKCHACMMKWIKAEEGETGKHAFYK